MIATLVMPKKTVYNTEGLPSFGKWLVKAMEWRGVDLAFVKDQTGIHYTQLYRTVHADRPTNAAYWRLGYENTVKVGALFNDIRGALEAANYPLPAELPINPTVIQQIDVTPEEREFIERMRALNSTPAPAAPQPAREEFSAGEQMPVARLPKKVSDIKQEDLDPSRRR
jgi:hypothetical protein